VKIHPHHIKLRSHWLRKPFLASAYRQWLVDESSLTARLQERYTDFYVQPLSQQTAKPICDEAAVLKLKQAATSHIREVLLFGDEQPVVYAHSVLPHASLRGAWVKLGRLGNQPLGAALFGNSRVKRTPLSYKKLSKNHVLYQQAIKHLSQSQSSTSSISKPPTYLWARRSIFSLNCAKILVTEVFLPQLCCDEYVS